MQFCERTDDIKLPRAKAQPTIPHSDVLKSYTRLLCLGKSDYEAIEPFCAGDEFFPLAFAIEVLLSCETLRQRFDQLGALRQRITAAEGTEPAHAERSWRHGDARSPRTSGFGH